MTSRDLTRIAWTEGGAGTSTLIWPPSSYTSIVEDQQDPIRAPILQSLAQHFRVVRYDQRGFGASDRHPGSQSVTAWCEDLEAVIEASAPLSSVSLFGVSQGAAAAIAYATRHPDHVSRLVLHGASPYGPGHVSSERVRNHYDSFIEVTRLGWAAPNPGFRLWVTAGLIKDASPAEFAWFDRFYPRCAEPAEAARFMEGWREMDLRPLLSAVRTPTLVTHNSGDQMTPAKLGRTLAAGIPSAEYVELSGASHVPRRSDGSLAELIRNLVGFLLPSPMADPFQQLSRRERDVLNKLCEGLSNCDLAESLGVKEKTVRNHVTAILAKLKVTSRTQAVVMAMRINKC